MQNLRIAVNTQTPLIRFKDDESDEIKFTTGGVTRMLLPLLRAWNADGSASLVEWIALAPGERDAPVVEHEGIRLSFVGLEADEKAGYSAVKERMWALLNSNADAPRSPREGGLSEAAWSAFDAYQSRCATALAEAGERMGGLDVVYVHDFQQLGVATAWRGPRVPLVFQLHTPFPRSMGQEWRDYFVGQLSKYTSVIVSTQNYAQRLREAGLRVPVHVVRPFIDPADFPRVAPDQAQAYRERFSLAQNDRIILNVGRMDPMKGQDRLIRALPEVVARVKDARLILVGNGSFSSSKIGGLGLSKGGQWRASLESLAHELGVSDRVTFTGHLGDDHIPAAYETSHVFCLPSTREGFGLAAVEAWRYEKPVIASDRTGVAELVENGVNGFALDCADSTALAARLVELLLDESLSARMGARGHDTSDEATLPRGRRALARVFDLAVASQRRQALPQS